MLNWILMYWAIIGPIAITTINKVGDDEYEIQFSVEAGPDKPSGWIKVFFAGPVIWLIIAWYLIND